MKSDKKSRKKTPLKEEQKEPLTRERFYQILNKVIRPVNEKGKLPKKEKKGTSG